MKLGKQFCHLSFGFLAMKPIEGETFGFEFIVGFSRNLDLNKICLRMCSTLREARC